MNKHTVYERLIDLFYEFAASMHMLFCMAVCNVQYKLGMVDNWRVSLEGGRWESSYMLVIPAHPVLIVCVYPKDR